MGNKNINMLDGAILPQIVRYAIPMIFTNILQLMFNVADLAVVGQFCGSTSVAAVGATSSVTQLIILFFLDYQLASVLLLHKRSVQKISKWFIVPFILCFLWPCHADVCVP